MDKAEKILNIATKRGFYFPSAEIYGGKAGLWTYGHLGTLMKRKFENIWRDYFLKLNSNYFEIEGNCILPKKVFEASGHLEHFKDPLVECKKCHFRFRADELIEDALNKNVEGHTEKEMDEIIKKNKLKCPKCGSSELGDVKFFNMMFEVKIGSVGDDVAYLSPETAQNAYLSFKREFLALREKLPLGLAIIGKAFRNEISPRQGFFRLREFTQAELQIFFYPASIDKVEGWDGVKDYKIRALLQKENKVKEIKAGELKLKKFYAYHLAKIQQFYLDILKIPKEKFRFRELSKEERAFYNKVHFDIELEIDALGGFKEVAGLHYRTNYDLSNHEKKSGKKMSVMFNNKRFIPHVLELSFGVDRNIYAFLDIFFKEEKERQLFLFPSSIAPVQVAVFPLVSKDELPKKAKHVYNLLKDDFRVIYDEKGSIGRMYRRVDEIGCNAMITIDYDSLNDDSVTIRNRDDMKQIRVKFKDLKDVLEKFLGGEKLNKLGKIV